MGAPHDPTYRPAAPQPQTGTLILEVPGGGRLELVGRVDLEALRLVLEAAPALLGSAG